jgi:hypothetical protein
MDVKQRRGLAALLALAAAASCADPRAGRVDPDDIWSEPAGPAAGSAALAFEDRAAGAAYGLPRAGQPSVADLLALFPQAPLGVDDPDIFVAPGVEVATDQCRGGDVVTLSGLPLTLEVVVTLYPRQYMKIPICGQDERHYGTYTVEDDTGGLIVLRDARVATFGHGDRIKLTVSGITLTYGRDVDTRAVLIGHVEPTGESGPVLYRSTSSGFTTDDVGQVKRIEGTVWQVPTNDNFSELVLASDEVPDGVALGDLTGDALTCALACEGKCAETCGKPELCGAACAAGCKDAAPGQTLTGDELPVCWIVGLGAELGRRGLTYPLGQPLRVTGPVVHNFERQIWVLDPGQVEILPN